MAQDRVELVNARTQVRGHGPIGGFSVDQKHSITEKDQTIHLSIDDLKAIAKFAGLTIVEQGTVQEFADSLKA
jgi:hypothetical protein